MLEWLAGVQRTDGEISAPHDETLGCIDDAPNTPAPVFAARAFKQLIWGTPKPEEIQRLREQPRRRTSRLEAKAFDTSGPDALSTAAGEAAIIRTPTKSPAKRPGILLTPGTGGMRRKTVSFERKQYNYQNGAILAIQPTATPRDIPGKFPTQAVPRTENNTSNAQVDVAKTAAPVIRQSKSLVILGKSDAGGDITLDMAAPRSISGNYWKREYDSFSAKSALELRKLAKKEQVAKKYAKSKDSEATKLTEMLRNEETKVIQLQKQVDEYVTQLSTIVRSNSDKVAGNRKNLNGHENINATKIYNDGGVPLRDTIHASPPRSSTRQLESALTNATATIESLKTTNTNLEAEISRLKADCAHQQKEIARLKGESLPINSSSTPRSSSRRTPKKSIDIPTSAMVVSDIWADVGNDVAEPPVRTLRRLERPVEKEVALKPRSLNLGGREGERGKESGLSDERREAAKKRLEERRRNREMGVGGG